MGRNEVSHEKMIEKSHFAALCRFASLSHACGPKTQDLSQAPLDSELRSSSVFSLLSRLGNTAADTPPPTSTIFQQHRQKSTVHACIRLHAKHTAVPCKARNRRAPAGRITSTCPLKNMATVQSHRATRPTIKGRVRPTRESH